MNSVFILDTNQEPQPPVHPAVARRLLSNGQAAVWRRYPFTLILKEAVRRSEPPGQLRVKIDPGSRTTGLALVDDFSGNLVWAGELGHRGLQVKAALSDRRAIRRGRRSRKTRYRPARFDNRRRPDGWLPPSLLSRVHNVDTWVTRLRKLAPVSAISLENVRFDTQKMENPEISGVAYQQGTLLGYEVREYLLEKWNRTCAYCGARNVPLEIEHIVPKSRSGSDRVSNLALSCTSCNQKKGNQTAREFGCPQVQAQARLPLRDAAAVNAVRYKVLEVLKAHGLPVETGSGGLTKFNRTRQGLAKSHWADAACVGQSTPERLTIRPGLPLLIQAKGRGQALGRRQMCKMNRFGFPRDSGKSRTKRVEGFQNGDLVRAVIPKGKYAGTHVGRVSIRSSGNFYLSKSRGNIGSVSWKYLTLLQRAGDYGYSLPNLSNR